MKPRAHQDRDLDRHVSIRTCSYLPCYFLSAEATYSATPATATATAAADDDDDGDDDMISSRRIHVPKMPCPVSERDLMMHFISRTASYCAA